MTDWMCRKCGAINLEGQRSCEACAMEPVGEVIDRVLPGLPRGMHVVRSKPLPAERPCTLEQSKAANTVLQAVLERRMTAAEGRQRLSEIFGMPELIEEGALDAQG